MNSQHFSQIHTFCFFALLVACSGPAQQIKQEVIQEKPKIETTTPEGKFLQAVQFYNEGKLQPAKDLLIAASQTKKTPAIFYNLALIENRLGNRDQSKDHLFTLQELDPNNLNAVLLLADIYMDEGNIKEAQKQIEKADKLNKDPYNREILYRQANIFRKRNMSEKAIESLRKVLARHQNDEKAFKLLFMVYYDDKNYQLAETISYNFLKINPNDADIYNNLGMIYVAKKEYTKALGYFQKSIAINKDHLFANLNLGGLALSHRDYNYAYQIFKDLAVKYPSNEEIQLALGYSLEGMKQLDASIAQFKSILKLNEKNDLAIYKLCFVYQRKNNVNDALEYCQKYADMFGSHLKSDDKIFQTITFLKQVQESEAAEKAKPKTPENPETPKTDVTDNKNPSSPTSSIEKQTSDANSIPMTTQTSTQTQPLHPGSQAQPTDTTQAKDGVNAAVKAIKPPQAG